MTRLTIRHETQYRYAAPVTFGAHRLLLRPRDSHSLRVLAADLTLSPPGETRWAYDALGNCVCRFTPAGPADHLTIVSHIDIERFPAPLAPIRIEDPQTVLPVVYDPADRVVLAPFMSPATADDGGELAAWVRSQLGQADEPALDFLLRMTLAIRDQLTYAERYAEGVLTPAETLRAGGGACRDFAWLMVEALRRLGYASRFVTGYLYAPANAGVRGAGATHAWAQVFLPDLGWLEFDPTNGLAESEDLITVAVARTPEEAAPISGTVAGNLAGSSLTVDVDVRAAAPLPTPA